MPIKRLNMLDAPGSQIILTGAAVDRLLLPGETAVVKYSTATSVPLNVATVEGIYELILSSDGTGTPAANNEAVLKPNNTSVNSTSAIMIGWTGSHIGTSRSSATGIVLELGNISFIHAIISTFTLTKKIGSKISVRQTGPLDCLADVLSIWSDTTTPWTSLGTLTFPYSQSGTVVIRRLA